MGIKNHALKLSLGLKMKRANKLTVNLKLKMVRPPYLTCVLEQVGTPPELNRVRYETGNVAHWSKSHLKKYYAVMP